MSMNLLPKDMLQLYKQKPLKENITEYLNSKITTEEITNAINQSPNNKATGDSGVSYELLKHLGPIALNKITQVFNYYLENSIVPPSWKLGIIIPIPKKPEVNGEIELYRPITLLEVVRKIFTRIITKRLYKIIIENNLLNGINVGFMPDKRATDVGFVIQRIMELARIKNENLELLALDVAKAYDSVSLNLLEISLKRIGITDKLIKIIIQLHSDRKLKILTKYGLTECFLQNSGLSQGDIISPLLWSIIYDPLLIYIRNTFNDKKNGNHFYYDYSALAMADDLTLITKTKTGMQEIINKCANWFDFAGIKVNPNKTTHISLKEDNDNSTQILNWPSIDGINNITNKHNNELKLRILGQYIIPNGDSKNLIEYIKIFSQELVDRFSNKALTDRIAQYITKMIIIPSVEYKLQGIPILNTALNSIESIIKKFIKHGFGLPTTFPSSYIYHKYGANIPSLELRLSIKSIELTTRILNGKGCTTFNKLMMDLITYTNKKFRFPGNMLEYPELVPHYYTYKKRRIGHMWIPYIANILHKRDISIKISNIFNNKETSILEIITAPIDMKLLSRIYDCNILYIKDLFKIDNNNNIIMIKKFENYKWYKHIKEKLNKHENIKIKIKKALSKNNIGQNLLIGKNILKKYKKLQIEPNQNEIIEIYTDGSIDIKNNIKAATFGIVIKCGNKISEYSGKVIEYAISSTLAEILGIFVSLILIPESSNIKIYSDSKSALNILKIAQNNSQNINKDKSNLSYLIYWIEYIISMKKLNIDGQWVKGHNGNILEIYYYN